MRSTFLCWFYNKCEWSELVECETYLQFMVKMKCDSCCEIDQNGKVWLLSWERGNNIQRKYAKIINKKTKVMFLSSLFSNMGRPVFAGQNDIPDNIQATG